MSVEAKIRAEGECRVCERAPGGHPLDALNGHEVVPRGQGGERVADNVVPLCGSGVTGCHALVHWIPVPAHPAGLSIAEALDLLNRRLTDRERAYADRVKYPGYVDDRYPRRERDAA